ncbi:MAG TPA: glycosyltransferase family 2 protein [Candidatus Saccharimonadales bacterium]|nr:glycosyltransferase family 2 protein [Candidatus Saccharimonadales bacterium]
MIDYTFLYELIRNLTRIFAALLLIKYTLFLLAAPFHRVKESLRSLRIAKSRKNKPYTPLVSVLVPAWNEEIGILSTVKSVLYNDYPFIEIIVINDGSSDGTDRIVKKFQNDNAEKFSLDAKSLVYDYKVNGGKGKALNHAIGKARGEIIITIDADSIADRHMVKNIVHYFGDDNVDAVVGNVKVAGEISFLNLLQRLEYLFGFYHKRAHSVLGAEYIYGGACAAFRRNTVFDQIGLFDTSSITEDIEMSLRTRYHGHEAVYADDAICYTEGANTVVGLIRQRLRWKKGRFEAFLTYKRMFFSTKLHHNQWLTWFILPFAMLAELQLLFEPFGLTLLVIYSYITGDYSSLVLGALFIGIMYIVVGLFTEKARNWWIIFIFPFTWMMFYALVWIEYLALMKSIAATFRSEAISWQKWHRKGISVKKGTMTRKGATS